MEKKNKPKMENNFDKYLWNKYEPLHDRLMRKISYLSKVLDNFSEIHTVKKNYYKTLKPIMKDDIQAPKEEENFQNVVSIVKSTNDKFIELEDQMYTDIIKNIKDLIDKMKKEKNYYDDYLKCLGLYKEEKKKMLKYQKEYHNSAIIAERATLNLKDLTIKKKINNDKLIQQQIDILELDSKNRLSAMKKDLYTYINSLTGTNSSREKLNEKQKTLLKLYQDLEKEDKNLYFKIMATIREYQRKILDFTGKNENYIEGIQKNMDIDRDIRALVESLRSRDKPEPEIPYIHYPTEIDFDKCQDARDYKVVNEVVQTMKQYSPEYIFNTCDIKLEEDKNKMRELIHKLFDNNKITSLEDKNQLREYVKNVKTHELFLIVLSKLRTNNRFCRDKPTIEFLSELLNEILNTAQKKNDFDNAKNCIILSQTFYYDDASKPKKKIYLIEYIKKHPWLKSKEFWNDFILTMILREFKKLEEMDEQKKINVLKNQNITDKIKVKLGEILFSQLLPYIGNMNEFQIDKKYIIKVVDNISSTFNYINKSNIASIENLVCEKKEELEKIKKEMKNDKALANFTLNKTLIKNASKTSEDEDEDEE
jgi:hypothetical protein